MKPSLSLKNAWYSLILLVAVVPVLLILTWGGTVYYQLLLEKYLAEEDYSRELVVSHVKQEITRLETLLENKSDPMAYTLSRKKDRQLLDELLQKVVERESAIHALLILDRDGQIITGMESYDKHTASLHDRSGLEAHLQHIHGNLLPEEIAQPLQGNSYISQVNFHPEGIFFKLSIPIGPPEQPLAILLAHVDARILWQDIQPNMQRKRLTSYLVDSKGKLLTKPTAAQYNVNDSVAHIPVVKAFIDGDKWQHDLVYDGLMGQQVFGNLSKVDNISLGIITEVDRKHILQPIRVLMIRLVIVAAIATLFFLWLGMQMLKRVINPINNIASDFKRVGKQDYTPSGISSSFAEIQVLVKGFNHMVMEIDHNQQKLQQAAIVFENTSDGIAITDANHRIISVNRAFSEITGYTEDEVIGKIPPYLKSELHNDAFYSRMKNVIKKTGKWRGEVCNQRENGEVYTSLLSINSFKDIGSFVYHIGVFSDISQIKETETKLEYLAHHDQLTDLPNRLLCIARMEHELQVAKRNEQQVAILFLDLDMFKNVNDSLGHAKGDYLLQQVAKRIGDGIREEDTIARLGGDEFVIIIGALESRQDAVLVAKNILKLLSAPFVIYEHEVFIGASIGISLYPNDGENSDILLRNADTAMYHAKSEGRNNYQFYTSALTKKASERLNIETYLRHAMEKDELQVYYQPQYSLHNKEMIGVEALLRWKHPEMGMVEPDRFIHIAEETGLIIPIGEWVLRTACRQLKEWMDAGYPSIRMAVNLSARQFWKPGLEKVIQNILDESGVNPANLELELTESIIMHDTLSVTDTLYELHRMGISLAVDDFGTGYSSLSYIQRFPLDRLKIDRSFVQDITTNSDDAEMIVSIIALAQSMKLQVLAEGVETKQQLLYLQEQGCDEVQGFYFGRPVRAKELEAISNSQDVKSKLTI